MSPHPDDHYNETSTPGAEVSFDDAVKTAALQIKPNRILYTSVLLALLQPFQSGWSTSQLNLSDYNNTDECNARPVVEGTCTLFSGHSKLEWTFAVNAWIFGAMVAPRAAKPPYMYPHVKTTSAPEVQEQFLPEQRLEAEVSSSQ
ncbi:hypothetical protein PPTG_13307 [Phytophthora nicotianae INRA-310]|uniref:Uncharacterized protein n=1 Tax=Phytophthora nicotianae (strain INRA-310) TaxID=761204 RepID=W2Q3G3_PHYN3|nr:hypothetical protein PPTG_13307 [Phytophthora nicotianae INRA-310]ETN07391.1 hypothetical protein PPTG_13307 [Phytophthora nicotianae INRA-310]